jgi:hypothetical protein
MGDLKGIPDSELLEYQDIIDFLILFYANKDSIDRIFLEKKAKEMNIADRFERLLKINFD